MKLRNKKTGEIRESRIANEHLQLWSKDLEDWVDYDDLDYLAEWWERYEEPKEIYYVNYKGHIMTASPEGNWDDEKQIGNYFETKEEAEKAVERLRAWKRLKDKGFKVVEWAAGLGDDNYKIGEVMVGFDIDGVYDGNVPDDTEKDLDLLFGGEE